MYLFVLEAANLVAAIAPQLRPIGKTERFTMKRGGPIRY
jgi:hypothetical protein